jgi:hypothetical protein
MPDRTSIRSNSGTERKNSSHLLLGAEAHHSLDPGAIVPAAVEQHDFARSGQMRGVALKIPLAAFALVGRGQRDDPADPRVEPLRDPLDRAALACGIAPLEDDDDLQPLVLNPILQPYQFMLKPEQFAKIDPPIELLAIWMIGQVGEHFLKPALVNFHLQFLVETVGDFLLDAIHVEQGLLAKGRIHACGAFRGRVIATMARHGDVMLTSPASM